MADNQFQKALGIVGPTGVGKTRIATEICLRLGTEIISCDSRQIYRELNIGTSKPSPEQRAKVKHHLLDIASIGEDFSAYRFREMVIPIMLDLLARGKPPVIVGGSGLYYEALTEGFFETPSKDIKMREELENQADLYGNERLWRELNSLDPQTAQKISISDRVRIIRALEIHKMTGVPKSMLEISGKYPEQKFNFTTIGINLPRKILYNRINQRVDEMLSSGWMAELEDLVKVSQSNSNLVRSLMGYGELLECLEGKLDYAIAVEKIKQAHRNYAKRQLTWFRKVKGIIWISALDSNLVERILAEFGQQ